MSGGRVVPDVLAAVDLGSNSFHMVVARYSHGQLVILDRLREMVRLAAGLGDSGRLDDAATERALRCLERFGQRLRAMHADSVRVVGTNALRRAKRKRWFLERARAALGHPIEIISGLEEARLIYSGVAHTSPMSPDKRLVIDIGGGSTEVVIGEGFNPLLLESLSVGCVGLTSSYFDDGRISEKRFERARTAVQARARADSGGLPQARLAAGVRQLRNGPRDRRCGAPAESGFAAHHARQSAQPRRTRDRGGPRR